MTQVRLAPGQHALVAYGSLLSIASMEQTLGHRYDGPWHVCRLNGWRRGWDVQMPKHPWAYRDKGQLVTPARVLYLNLRRQEGSHVNGTLFVVDEQERVSLDEREWIYQREQVNDDLTDIRITGGPAWAYVALDEFLWRKESRPPEAIIRRSYLEILARAHAELGDEFRAEYHATTDAVPSHLVVDDERRER